MYFACCLTHLAKVGIRDANITLLDNLKFVKIGTVKSIIYLNR